MPPHQSPFVREATIPLDPITLDWKHRKQLIQSSNNTASSGSQARARASRVRHAADPILKPTPEPPAEEDQDPEPSLATYSLKKYLQESWFPVFQLGPRAKQDFIWPHYPELHAPLGTRKLRAISRIMPYRIHGAACDCAFRRFFWLIYSPKICWQTLSGRRIGKSSPSLEVLLILSYPPSIS
jgi:hypothetical protein